MTTKPEVKLPELSEHLSESMMKFGVAYRRGSALDRVFHLTQLQDAIKACAQEYGTLCYEAGLAAGRGQAGQQEVNIGSVPPCVLRSRNSEPSSITVRSAAKDVS